MLRADELPERVQTALRLVPPRFFGVFMSVHPVLAALVGLVVLGQVLLPNEWIGIAVVVLANAVAVASSSTAGATDIGRGRMAPTDVGRGRRCGSATVRTATASSPSCCTG